MSYYEDFYEPSEYDEMVEEFKNTLRESVKQEWKDRMAKLEAENRELQDVKKNFESIKQEYENKMRSCEWEKERVIANAKRDAEKERLSELFEDMQSSYWKIKRDHIKKPKCDKCDRNRQIEYITPLGRKAKEFCTCNESETKYVPCEMVIYTISLNNHKLGARFVKKNQEDEVYVNDSEYHGNKTIIKDQDDVSSLSEDDMWSFYFESEEKCQAYCDWLNNKVEVE